MGGAPASFLRLALSGCRNPKPLSAHAEEEELAGGGKDRHQNRSLQPMYSPKIAIHRRPYASSPE
nr:hypothetical protein Iba_chr09bCG12390 [Ipomoea batatas]